MTEAMERIAAERQRQIEKEGWTAEHDAKHKRGDLARAGACYAVREYLYPTNVGPEDADKELWPFDKEWDKRKSTSVIRGLEKAGALIAAELEKEIVWQAGWEKFEKEAVALIQTTPDCLLFTCSCGDAWCWYEGNLEYAFNRHFYEPCQKCGKIGEKTMSGGKGEEYEL
jgi:hypothetical protein